MVGGRKRETDNWRRIWFFRAITRFCHALCVVYVRTLTGSVRVAFKLFI